MDHYGATVGYVPILNMACAFDTKTESGRAPVQVMGPQLSKSYEDAAQHVCFSDLITFGSISPSSF